MPSSEKKPMYVSPETGLLSMYVLTPMFMTLFFLESMRVFIGLVYFENLGAMTLGLSVLYVFLLLSPILAPLVGRLNAWRAMLATSVVMVVLRAALSVFQTFDVGFILLTAGLATAVFGLYLPVVIAAHTDEWPSGLPPKSQAVVIGLALGAAADLMLRMLGTTWDLSTGLLGLPVTTLMLASSVIVLWVSRLSGSRPAFIKPSQTSLRLRAGRVLLGTGFGGVLFLFLSFLLYPNVIARWTGSSFELALAFGTLALFLYVLVSQFESARAAMGRPLSIIIADVLILLGVADLAVLHLPLAGLTASGALFGGLIVVRALWESLDSSSLSGVSLFHFMAMVVFLFTTLLYVLTLVAGQILPALEGLAPLVIWVSAGLAVLASLGPAVRARRQEVK